jgi:hypothetical protein
LKSTTYAEERKPQFAKKISDPADYYVTSIFSHVFNVFKLGVVINPNDPNDDMIFRSFLDMQTANKITDEVMLTYFKDKDFIKQLIQYEVMCAAFILGDVAYNSRNYGVMHQNNKTKPIVIDFMKLCSDMDEIKMINRINALFNITSNDDRLSLKDNYVSIPFITLAHNNNAISQEQIFDAIDDLFTESNKNSLLESIYKTIESTACIKAKGSKSITYPAFDTLMNYLIIEHGYLKQLSNSLKTSGQNAIANKINQFIKKIPQLKLQMNIATQSETQINSLYVNTITLR